MRISLDLAACAGVRSGSRDLVDPLDSDGDGASCRRLGRLGALEFARQVSRRTGRRLALRAIAPAQQQSSRLSAAAPCFRRASVESRRKSWTLMAPSRYGASVLRALTCAAGECGRTAARYSFGAAGGPGDSLHDIAAGLGSLAIRRYSCSHSITSAQSLSFSLASPAAGGVGRFSGRDFARVWRPGPRTKGSLSWPAWRSSSLLSRSGSAVPRGALVSQRMAARGRRSRSSSHLVAQVLPRAGRGSIGYSGRIRPRTTTATSTAMRRVAGGFFNDLLHLGSGVTHPLILLAVLAILVRWQTDERYRVPSLIATTVLVLVFLSYCGVYLITPYAWRGRFKVRSIA